MALARKRPHRIQATTLDLTSRLRGLYRRVANRLGVHPSYVSRIARGERRSKIVESALRREIRIALLRAGKLRKSKRKPSNRKTRRSGSK